MSWFHKTVVAALLVAAAGLTAPVAAQTVSTSDIQRLQDLVYDAGGDIARMRASDARRATDLQTQLDELRDEVTYLKVKMRKEGSVDRREFTELRGRIEDLRSQARSGAGTYTPSPNTGVSGGVTEVERSREERRQQQSGTSGAYESRAPRRATSPNEVPEGTELDVRLEAPLTSKTAQVEDRFIARTVVDLRNDDRVLIPAGSVVRGVVTSVDRATRIDRKGKLTVSFDQITISGRTYPIHATVTQAIESEGIRGEAGRIGTGAGVGAIIGGILGGFKGALAGILIGAGGTVAATEGTDVDLPPGTVLRLRLDSPIVVR
jgi:hypothetical protein